MAFDPSAPVTAESLRKAQETPACDHPVVIRYWESCNGEYWRCRSCGEERWSGIGFGKSHIDDPSRYY